MKYLRIALGIVAVALVALILVPDAQAQATRTWVSGVGDDVNPCSRTAPCKTFAGAISKTAAHGEISVLDPGGFGALNITKSITLNGDGTLAGILAAGTTGIIVNPPLATDKVMIRSITINGANSGTNGIRFIGQGTLTVENVAIYSFNGAPGRALDVTGAGEMILNNVTITDCQAGVRIASSGSHTATLDNVRIQDINGHAFEAASGSVFALITRSRFTNNGADAVRAGVSSSTIMVEDSSLSFNSGTGANAAVSGSKIRIKGNNINVNNVGIAIAGGAVVESTGTNTVIGNVSNTAPNGTYTQQ
ncbi:MAG TPA: right-handed parallel beta-helix repeat-containing protein [Candidatus Acidoferrum sp.]|nr:right-handed parallel beta-helix repeat-containing protein [Candidatus Acidoferrum sp.]